jgi:hypothetical protein
MILWIAVGGVGGTVVGGLFGYLMKCTGGG